MKNSSIMSVFLLSLVLTLATLAEPYHHPSGLFSFTPPPGWTKVKEEPNRVAFNAPDEAATLQVSIHTSLLVPSGFNDKAYVAKLMSSFSGIGFSGTGTTKTKIGSIPALRLDMSGDKTPMGRARGFNIFGSTHQGKRLAFMGMATVPVKGNHWVALENAARSLRQK